MKRAAFTMIELIFVIVILGILASVAIPKLAGVQDDAYVSLEKSGIASVKSGALAVRSRALLRGTGVSFNIDADFDSATAPTGVVLIDGNTTADGSVANMLHASSRYPYGLSVLAAPTTDGATVTAAFDAPSGTGVALAMVLGSDGRLDWGTVKDGNTTVIAGPATLNVNSATAEYNQAGSWTYNSATGLVNYNDPTQSGNAYKADKGGS